MVSDDKQEITILQRFLIFLSFELISTFVYKVKRTCSIQRFLHLSSLLDKFSHNWELRRIKYKYNTVHFVFNHWVSPIIWILCRNIIASKLEKKCNNDK